MVPWGSWCAASVQSTPLQEVTWSDTHVLPEGWNPALQLASAQVAGADAVDAVQVPVPLGKAVVQFVVGEPQALSVSASQAAPF
jgi:hypothetical protein